MAALAHVRLRDLLCFSLFFFTDTAPTEIYTLSLHDALPISVPVRDLEAILLELEARLRQEHVRHRDALGVPRSEEHTSELQSHSDLVCRLLLEKKKRAKNQNEVGHQASCPRPLSFRCSSRQS